MEHLILILCLAFVFAIVAGLHLYTMKKIGDVQKNLMMEGKYWRALEKASASSLYTMIMLFLFSVLLAVPITGVVKMYLLLDYVVGG